MNKFILLLCFLISAFKLCSQQKYTFENVGFSKTLPQMTDSIKSKNEVVLWKDEKIEIVNDDKFTYNYQLLHQITYVNSDEAIERNNKVYVTDASDITVIKNWCRVILPDGKIIDVDENDIHEEKDEQRQTVTKYFAVKGLTKGAIIERIFIKRSYADLSGIQIDFQGDVAFVHQKFELIYPKHLEFFYKNYNGLKEPVLLNDAYEGKNSLTFQEENLHYLPTNQRYSNLERNRKKAFIKLDKNLGTGKRNFFNYKDFVAEIYENLIRDISKKEEKLVNEFLSKVKGDTEYDKILSLENQIKSTFTLNRYEDYHENLAAYFAKKQLNTNNTLKLYKFLLDRLSIENQIVFTSNRYRHSFDPEFETTKNLQEILFYCPKSKVYIDPSDVTTRIPIFSYGHGHNYGLFVREKEFGGAKVPVSEVKYIELPNMDITKDSMFITVDFTNDMDKPVCNSRLVFGGYAGYGMQPISDYVEDERYQEILKDLAKNYAAEVDNFTVKSVNHGFEHMGKNNFELQIEAVVTDLVEIAGNKTLFKLGQLIGKQIELYQADDRVFPVEINYPHYYYRELYVKLPEGYKISNPESMEKNLKLINNGVEEAIFVSENKVLPSNTYKITNVEFYKVMEYPVSSFDQYKAVVNAAADFNKIVIIIEKK